MVTRRLWVDAVNGSLGAQKEIMNRIEGMPAQTNLIGNADDRKFEIEVTESKSNNIDEQ